ncbi:MAG: aminopeptidase N, partial [Pseudomonadales bacterium]|nr:aminopeptidase N [Pseudomonadales bacterium]
MSGDNNPGTVYLRDYRAPDFFIDKTELNFQLGELTTLVNSVLTIRRNPDAPGDSPLVLDGVELSLRSVMLNGKNLSADQYAVDDRSLTIANVPDTFELQCVTLIKPQSNTSLEGLYKSKTMFCTQCEAEGFRKITYYLDRPDVMSRFTTTILADKNLYPVLLSNGNEEDRGELGNGMHWVRWKDPFKKPCYLFALVAGNLKCREDIFITKSGRKVKIQVYVEARDLNKVDHAITSLKNAMRWDEKVYGREYDLDTFMIVAVDDFNMGAMENKGLNIFNTSCVLAKSDSTTDNGFKRVEAVVAHEYFHNWSGNRVTCRDWFQLSLKEGFTVFRDAQFSADMGSPVVKRIEDATLLRTAQFAEDASPMAHPVQPDAYMEISNFYTLTVYEKGAEVVRMIHTLLGEDVFRQGSDLYFDTYDGQAVTIEEFVSSMEAASGKDLTQFRRWYTQAGTPTLTVTGDYNKEAATYTLKVAQSCPPTAECAEKQPFHIPFAIGLLGEGGALPLKLAGSELDTETADNTSRVLEVTQTEQEFVFENIGEKPVPSLLRNFSAPVKLDFNYSFDDLVFLMSRDHDGFNRWEASQQLSLRVIKSLIEDYRQQKELQVDPRLIDAFKMVLEDSSLDKAMQALMLELPSEAYIGECSDTIDVEAIHHVRLFVRKALAVALKEIFHHLYQANMETGIYMPTAEAMAQRSLKNTALSYLMLLNEKPVAELCLEQFNKALNMTDSVAALMALINCDADFIVNARDKALRLFYRRWQNESLVVNQWFMMQALSRLPGTLQKVKELMQHEAYDPKNPNKIRSLIGAFCSQNAIHFHAADGEGYRFLSDQVISLNRQNPQIASRLLAPLTKWKRYDQGRQQQMKAALQHIKDSGSLSP